MKQKKIVGIVVGVVLIVIGLAIFIIMQYGVTNNETHDVSNEEASSQAIESQDVVLDEIQEENLESEGEEIDMENLKEIYNVEINIENRGVIALELYTNTAPITVANFVKLVEEGFYNGLTFHRIIDGFMIQGGDPLGNGTGGSNTEIKGEFSTNGIENELSHTRGVVSMARSSMPNSASSQFFIVHEDATFLDGQYASFGMVTSGMEIVDVICKETIVIDNNGTTLAEGQPKIIDIKIID